MTKFDIIRTELNTLDPLDVIMNNPHLVDEYDSENQAILAILDQCNEYTDLASYISDIFNKNTDSHFDKEYFYDCAKNILNKIQSL